MRVNVEEIRARTRLLLAADKWRDLTQLLEHDIPILIAEVERLRQELAEAKRGDVQPRIPDNVGHQPFHHTRVRSDRVDPERRCRSGGGASHPVPFNTMFNFSTNHLCFLSRKEYRSSAVMLLLDRDTQRVYRLHDFTNSHHLVPGQAYCMAGKVNGADKLYLVVESVRPDTKHARPSTTPVSVDGVGENPAA